MNRKVLFVAMIFFAGCGADRALFPGFFDRNLGDYTEERQSLEHRYLRKEITYAQYLDLKAKLEDEYNKGEQHRRAIVENQPVEAPR